MKKRLTALALALAMVSALVIGAAADGESKAAESAAAPDAESGTLHFEALEERMRAGYFPLRSLEENIAYIESFDYTKLEDEARDAVNSLADMQYAFDQIGNAGSMLGSSPAGAAVGAVAGGVGMLAQMSLPSAYEQARDAFESIRDGELQKDNADRVRQMENASRSLVAAGETVYITILGLEEQSTALARQSAALDRTIEELELRYELGQISAMMLQQAKNGKTQLESGKATLDMNLAQLRRQLNAMVGSELSATLTLGALPTVTAEQLAAMDAEKDLEKAKQASLELYTARQTLDDADETYEDSGAKYSYNAKDYKKVQARHVWNAAQYTYSATVQSFELSFLSLYDSVKNYAQVLTAAQTALEVERSDLAAAQLKFEQGSISENALRTAEDELYTAQNTVSGAERDLLTAYREYCRAVEYGLLNS